MAKPVALLPLLLLILSTHLAFSYRSEQGSPRRESRYNPYHFSEDSFQTVLSSREGKLRVLERFSEQSDLLRGIDNYRVALFQANPNTALIPTHCDCDSILFVAAGSATITLLRQENRESYNLRAGDIQRVQAGTTIYIINNDNKEKLCITKFFEPISTPGQFQPFFGIGGQNPESYLMSFSKDILQAAYNTEYDRVKRVFGQHQAGPIMQVPHDKIREIAQQASSSSSHGGRRSPSGRGWSDWRGPFNLFETRPTLSNQHGQLREADANDYPALRDLDIAVSFAKIRNGSMIGPYYNSRATQVAVVMDGNGYVQMACPHLSEQSEEEREQGRRGRGREQSEQEREQGPRGTGREQGRREQESVSYQSVSANVSPGDVFVAPAGHPIVTVANQDQALLVLCFEINAENNEKYTLAGRGNIYNKLNRPEKEVFFKESERELDGVLRSQRDAGIFEGPQGRWETGSEGRSDA